MNDAAKQLMLDELSKESMQVISVAYAYAKNMVALGVDVTEAWTTVSDQQNALEQAYQRGYKQGLDRGIASCSLGDKIVTNNVTKDILDFIEDNRPTEVHSDWERGCAYVCDEIEKIAGAESNGRS